MIDGFVDHFSTVVTLLVSDHASDAVQILSEISQVGKVPGKKLRAPRFMTTAIGVNPRKLPMPSKRWQAEIFARDRYTCQYCGILTITVPVMNAVSALYPTVFRCHPHWKAEETDVAYWTCSTSLDHIVPLTRGGTNDFKNLTTACWRCNELKGNSMLEEIVLSRIEPRSERLWDGLSLSLKGLVTRLVQPPKYYAEWVRAIEHRANTALPDLGTLVDRPFGALPGAMK